MRGGIEEARLDWDAEAPRSVFFSDIYFSGEGAAESRHVFAEGNGLPARFAAADRFVIGELGFGTGLNILVASDLWRRTEKRPGARLDFLSFEKYPLAKDDLRRAHAAWPQFAPLSRTLIDALPPPIAGAHRLRLDHDVTLTLCLGEARTMLSSMEAAVDAWFLDGFAPAKNPDMWTPEIFAEIARLSKPGASASTFTVAGDVRRALQGAGFAIEKRPGFGRKREMLTARLQDAPSSAQRTPWFANVDLKPLAPGARAAIIGGGVAGASLAHELGQAGIDATIFAPEGLADGASGNPAGLVMPRLDLSDGGGARFFRAAYIATLSLIDRLQRESGEVFFNPCGVHLKATDDEARARRRKIMDAALLPENFIDAREDGLFFPQAGVVDPARFCQALAAGAEIVAATAETIVSESGGVRIQSSDGARRAFDAVFIANGRDALKFVAARSLPLSGVMGQVDHFRSAPAPAFATAFGPYAAPAPSGGLVIGATYEKIDACATPRTSARATNENIAALGAALDAAASEPRASVRCQTPDRLPVAGPLPDWNFYGAAYDDLRLGKARDYPPGAVQPGLFILSGLGSRGLVTAPYAAALMIAEAGLAPFERDIAEAIHPARFFIRDLKRSQKIAAK